MLFASLTVGIVGCAVLALRAVRLLGAALWLACTSALLSILLYLLGGHELAVIELSVGAGLVTVLFIFALNLLGEQAPREPSVVAKPLAAILSGAVLLLIGLLIFPLFNTPVTPGISPVIPAEVSFSNMLWQQRGLDVLLQIAVIFAGVLSILGLLSQPKSGEPTGATTAQVAAASEPPPPERQSPLPEKATEVEKVEEYA